MTEDTKPPDEGRPTLAEVMERYETSRQHWASWRGNAEVDTRFYFEGVPKDGKGGFSLRGEDGKLQYHEIRPPLVKDAVHRLATRLFANEPVFRVERPMGLEHDEATTRMEREADYAEALAHTIIHHATRATGVGNFNNSIAKNIGITGMGVIACWYDESDNPRPTSAKRRSKAHQQWLERRRTTLPIVWESWWPLDVYPSPDQGKSWVIRRCRRTGWDIIRRYPDWTAPDAAQNPAWKNAYYDFLIYCDDKWYWHGVFDAPTGRDSQELDAQPHFWHCVPVHLVASGFGIDTGLPEQQFIGVCRWAIEGGIVTALARNASQRDAINSSMAWPTTLYPAKWVAGDAKLDFSPGKDNPVAVDDVSEISTGFRIVQGATAPQGIYLEGQVLREEFFNSTVPEAVGSGEAAASDPTSKYIRRLAEAGTTINPTKQAVEEAYEAVMMMVLRAFKDDAYFGADESFTAHASLRGALRRLEVNRDSLPDDPIIRCVLDPERQYEKSARLQMGLELRKANEIDSQTFQEDFAGRDDGGREIRRRMRRQKLTTVLEDMLVEFIAQRATGQVPPTTSFPQFAGQRMAASTGQGGLPQGSPESMAAQGVVPEPGAPVQSPSPNGPSPEMMM